MVNFPFKRTILILLDVRKNGFIYTLNTALIFSFQALNPRRIYLPKQRLIKVNGSWMLVYPKKKGIQLDLYLCREREPLCTKILLNNAIIKQGDCILDIGANIGYYVLLESRLVGDFGIVYGVEPVKTTFALLKENVSLNRRSNVELHNLAVGDKNEQAEIYVSDKSNLSAMRKEASGGTILGTQAVNVITIDYFLVGKRFPNLIRMDVEGYEYEIVKGMEKTLQKADDLWVMIELHVSPKQSTWEHVTEILSTLEKNNFKIRYVIYNRSVKDNKVFQYLRHGFGTPFPYIARDISYSKLLELLKGQQEGPNILFQKQN